MPEDRIRVAPNTVAYADRESHKLVVEFAIPGAPTETIDVKILEDSVYLTAPAKDIEYVSALALGWPVKPDKAEATYEYGLLRIEVPFKDPMEGAVKIAIKEGGAETKTKTIEGQQREAILAKYIIRNVRLSTNFYGIMAQAHQATESIS
jgi:hypothetical protein